MGAFMKCVVIPRNYAGLMKFSERMGLVDVRDVIQVGELDEETRVALWNIIYQYLQVNVIKSADYMWASQPLARKVWSDLLGGALDVMESTSSSDFLYRVKYKTLEDEYYEALDTVEFFARYGWKVDGTDHLRTRFNTVFTRELVGYRIVGWDIVPVTDDMEVDAIQAALEDPKSNAGVKSHLNNALALLADRANPDYANSIKESISAVESCLRERTGKTTISAALKEIDKRGKEIHPALSDGWQKIYAYTSDSDGIRHGSITASEATEALATYFLVTCSSFINYVTKAYNN